MTQARTPRGVEPCLVRLSSPASLEQWSPAQVAAVAAAEAIAATAAADVAAEAAVAARRAVDVACATAARAAATASDVAALAVLAVAAAAADGTSSPPTAAAAAADKVARRVAAVATAAARAAVEAKALIVAQLAADVAATAAAVTVAATHAGPQLTEQCGEGGDAVAHLGDHTVPTYPAVLTHGVLDLAETLRRGIAAGELRLHYQPIVDLSSGRPVGVEALVRWQHPERGLLAPDQFLGLAECSDLVLPLGDWVLDEACCFAVELQQRAGESLTVAVNLSGRQLSDGQLVATVRAALDRQQCAAGLLVFEVTETAVVTDMGAAVASLRTLAALGAGVAIDDFGTGYSSMLYLKHLSADTLKIDRTFISEMTSGPHDTAIVASLISLAHNLDVRCIAEGVETAQQLELLTQLGCDLAQGYLFCHPLEAPALVAWLDQQPTTAVQKRPWVARSPEVARITAMRDNGFSVHTIAAALNAEGNQTSGGFRWSGRSVAQILDRTADPPPPRNDALRRPVQPPAPGPPRHRALTDQREGRDHPRPTPGGVGS
jgi:EAL domain-containing protein (putative c-di-GMP-specific phosphodiesterase class I)